MTTETKTIESISELSGSLVKFEDQPMGVIGQATLLTFGLCPESFENYRDDARALIRVIKGEGKSLKKDRKQVERMELNSMGVSNLLAALCYEIAQQGYQNSIPR